LQVPSQSRQPGGPDLGRSRHGDQICIRSARGGDNIVQRANDGHRHVYERQVRPALGQAIARVGAAVGLGILAPPLALLPLIDLGDAPDANCAALYRDVRMDGGNTKASPAKERKRAGEAGRDSVAKSGQASR